MENVGDAESYWNRSASKAFNFDDEEDATDLFSAPEKPSTSTLNVDDISEASFDNTPSDTLDMSIDTIICEEDLKTILEEQSMDNHIVPKGISPENELKLLRRRLQYLTNAPSVEYTANLLIMGKRCSLEAFKSLTDKEQLLDEVIRLGCGDAVLAVVLFLSKTLNRKQFNRILLTRRDACTQYINYLVQTNLSEAIDLLTMLGNHQEAAVLQIKTLLNSQADVPTRRKRLQQYVSDYMHQPGAIPIYNQILKNALSLLENHDKLQALVPSDRIATELSPVEILYYSCSKNKWKDTTSTDPLSPYNLMMEHKISAPQFEWTLLNERAKSQAFVDLEAIFEKSTWHGIGQKQFHISFPVEYAIQRLHALNAPNAVLHMFLSKMTDTDKKLALAKQVTCPKAVIDALVSLKDAQELERYSESLTEGTEEKFYCEQALKGLNSRRWTKDSIKIKM